MPLRPAPSELVYIRCPAPFLSVFKCLKNAYFIVFDGYAPTLVACYGHRNRDALEIKHRILEGKSIGRVTRCMWNSSIELFKSFN